MSGKDSEYIDKINYVVDIFNNNPFKWFVSTQKQIDFVKTHHSDMNIFALSYILIRPGSHNKEYKFQLKCLPLNHNLSYFLTLQLFLNIEISKVIFHRPEGTCLYG